jgi:hypothetical protein
VTCIKPIDAFAAESAGWNSRAKELTRWTLDRLVNRTDACGRYGDNGARAIHPDRGGSTEAMQVLNDANETFSRAMKA